MICVWLSSPDDQLVQRGGGGGREGERDIYFFAAVTHNLHHVLPSILET